MTIERNSRESLALDLLRFPLAALVVLLHTAAPDSSDGFTYCLANYVNAPIVQVAVPGFFLMSGYLFFAGKEEFGWTVYKKKIGKKVRSLLVPYIIWNYIALFLGYGYTYYKSRTIGTVMPWDLMEILWAHGDGIMATSPLGYEYPVIVSPVAGVLWFMRDLVMMMLCSIVSYHIIKRLKWWIFPILILLNVFKIGFPFAGFSLAAITFFNIGAFFSIHQIHVFDWLVKHETIWLVLWPLFVILQTIGGLYGYDLNSLDCMLLMCGVAFVFVLAYKIAAHPSAVVSIVARWGETSFFIYAFGNTLILWFVNKNVGYMLETIPYIGSFLNYEFLFVARVVECVVVYYVMKRSLPRLLGILIGGRVK